MTTRKIKISAGFTLRAVLGNDAPTADGVKDLIFGAALPEDDDPNSDVIRGLVRAYMALLDAEEEDFEIVSDDEDYAAEKLYREFAIKGWRQAVGSEFPEAAKSRTDDEVYENCPWYDFGKMTWPVQLIAEIGFLAGYKAGREGIAMHHYVEDMEAKHGKDWWKNA